MNQKNIFTIMGIVLILQGIVFFMMGSSVVASAFPNLDEAGRQAPTILMEVMGVMSVAVGLIAYATRNNAQVLWAFTFGFVLFSLVSLKHLLSDHINVPVPAIAIQLAIVLACGYLWMQSKNANAS